MAAAEPGKEEDLEGASSGFRKEKKTKKKEERRPATVLYIKHGMIS
ncbi:hypothetical protein [Candidatus Nitrospira nitrosa]|jgi:hypothetical protein|nr:hypothetical protein [Candidatus Nitrospira nitrosa]